MKARETLAQMRARDPLPKTPVADASGSPSTRDRFGDALPRGASARLGTTRLRHSLAAFTPDGKSLAGISANGLYLTNLATGVEGRAFTGKRLDNCLDVAVSPNGRFLAVNFQAEDMRKESTSSTSGICSPTSTCTVLPWLRKAWRCCR